MIDAMGEKLSVTGSEIRLGTPAFSWEKQEKWLINGEKFDVDISIHPPQITKSLLQGDCGCTLPEIIYHGAAV